MNFSRKLDQHITDLLFQTSRSDKKSEFLFNMMESYFKLFHILINRFNYANTLAYYCEEGIRRYWKIVLFVSEM